MLSHDRPLTAVIDLPLEDASASRARRAVREAFTTWGVEPAEWTYDSELAVSELVANAVRHGGVRVELAVSLEPDALRVSVADGCAVVPVAGTVDDDAESGRGIAILEAVAAAWGVEQTDDGGKRVWAEVRRS